MTNPLPRRLLAEYLGSAFPAAVVVGSGIAAQRLSPDDPGLALLENAAATAAGLFAIILMFGPVSGGRFNPVVSLVDAYFGGLSRRDALAYVPAQIAGCITGAPVGRADAGAQGGRGAVRAPASRTGGRDLRRVPADARARPRAAPAGVTDCFARSGREPLGTHAAAGRARERQRDQRLRHRLRKHVGAAAVDLVEQRRWPDGLRPAFAARARHQDRARATPRRRSATAALHPHRARITSRS